MTKQDYILLARAIRREEYEKYDNPIDEDIRAAFALFTSKLTSWLQADNPRFNREKFYNAAIGS